MLGAEKRGCRAKNGAVLPPSRANIQDSCSCTVIALVQRAHKERLRDVKGHLFRNPPADSYDRPTAMSVALLAPVVSDLEGVDPLPSTGWLSLEVCPPLSDARSAGISGSAAVP